MARHYCDSARQGERDAARRGASAISAARDRTSARFIDVASRFGRSTTSAAHSASAFFRIRIARASRSHRAASDVGGSAKNAVRRASHIPTFPQLIVSGVWPAADAWQVQAKAFRRIAAKPTDLRLAEAASYLFIIGCPFSILFHFESRWPPHSLRLSIASFQSGQVDVRGAGAMIVRKRSKIAFR